MRARPTRRRSHGTVSMSSTRRPLLAVAAAVVLTACGGGSDAPRGGAEADRGPLVRIDACNLLSPAEVGQTLGTPVSEPSEREAGSDGSLATICVYDGGWPNTVNITVRQSAQPGQKSTSAELAARLNQDLDTAADSAMPDIEGGGWQPLEMAGHAAAVRDAGEGGWTTVVRKNALGSVEVLVNAPTREVALAVAGAVMERLESEP